MLQQQGFGLSKTLPPGDRRHPPFPFAPCLLPLKLRVLSCLPGTFRVPWIASQAVSATCGPEVREGTVGGCFAFVSLPAVLRRSVALAPRPRKGAAE